MRTPVVVITGQGDSDAVAKVLLRQAGTVLVEHRFDGHVVHRRVTSIQVGMPTGFDAVLGARGSKLQLVLNSIFHLEASPGNVAAADFDR